MPVCRRCGGLSFEQKGATYHYTCTECGLRRNSKSFEGPCSRCGADKGEGRRHRWCKECFNEARNARWKAKKLDFVERLGGACMACGWSPSTDKEYAAMDFHHRDPSTKEQTMGGNWLTTKRAEVELAKCDLLCARCHRIHHANEWGV